MNNIEKKIEELKSEFLTKLEALQKEVKMQKKQEELKPWKPEIGDSYFYISSNFEAMNKVRGTTSFETDRISNGNCFRTKKRAEQAAKKMRLLLQLEQLHDMLCPDYVPDWNNDGELKFCLGYDHADDCWLVDYFNVSQYPTVYFDTNENAKKALEILNKEIKNYE